MAEKCTESSVATPSSIPNWWSELHASCFSMEFKAASVLFLLLCSALVLSSIFVCSGAFSFPLAFFVGRLVCCPAGVLSCCCFVLVGFLFCSGCLRGVPQFQLRPSSNKILIYPKKKENTINRWIYPKPNPNSSCEESVSISISFTNSSNHSGLSIDSSPPLFDSASTNELMGETASDNHLQNLVLGSSGSSGQLHNNHDAGEKLLDTIGMFEPAFDCLKKTENSWEFTNSTSFNNFEKHYDGFNESLIESENLNKQSNLGSNWSIALPNLEVNPQFETRACNISFSSRTDQYSQSDLCDVKEKVSDSTAFVGGINRNSETVLKKRKNENPTVSSAKMRVPKVKLGDKITALQQIVSPFGKTDTASVLLEAIGYIKFLQVQIQILSNPYMKTNVSKDPWGGLEEKDRGHTKLDLKGRGLCLVPITSIP